MTWHSGVIKSNQYPLVNQLILFSYSVKDYRTFSCSTKAEAESHFWGLFGIHIRDVCVHGGGVGWLGVSCCVGFDCFLCAWIGSFWLPPTPTMEVSLICKLHAGANVSLCVCLYIAVLCEWGELVTCLWCSLPPLRACWNHILPPA